MNVQAYSGHIEAGCFYTNDGVVLPDCRDALLVIGNVIRPNNGHAMTWKKFFDTINACDEELPETIERVNITREISI